MIGEYIKRSRLLGRYTHEKSRNGTVLCPCVSKLRKTKRDAPSEYIPSYGSSNKGSYSACLLLTEKGWKNKRA